MSLHTIVKNYGKRLLNYIYALENNLRWDCEIGSFAYVLGCKMGKYVSVGRNSNLGKSILGDYSYVGDNCMLYKVKIGKFCSIGNNVICTIGNHPIDMISTSPFTFSKRKGSFSQRSMFEEELRYLENGKICEVGNDVWIGTGVVIVCGKKPIRIGDGAIIAAGAIVTKDVEPYSIVAGAPAKIMKYRFCKEDITFIHNSKWWDNNEEWLKKNVKYFTSISEYRKVGN